MVVGFTSPLICSFGNVRTLRPSHMHTNFEGQWQTTTMSDRTGCPGGPFVAIACRVAHFWKTIKDCLSSKSERDDFRQHGCTPGPHFGCNLLSMLVIRAYFKECKILTTFASHTESETAPVFCRESFCQRFVLILQWYLATIILACFNVKSSCNVHRSRHSVRFLAPCSG